MFVCTIEGMSFLDRLRGYYESSTVRQAREATLHALAEAEAWRETALELRETGRPAVGAEFREALSELELQIEDSGWRRLAAGGMREFSRNGLSAIARMSRLMFLKNPLVNRAIELQSMYVHAQGVQITSSDERTQQAIVEVLTDRLNDMEIGQQARRRKECDLQVTGNLFFLLTTNVIGKTYVRSIPFEEITEVVTNPDDGAEPWLYKRVWIESVFNAATGQSVDTERTAYYPAFRCSIEAPAAIAGVAVQTDAIYHVKVGALSDMKFGVSEVYQGIDWAMAYKSFLEDWATISRAYTRFAFHLKPGGGKPGIASAKTTLGTTLGTGTMETNPAAPAGSYFIGGDNVKLDAVKTANATTNPEQARRLLLMFCASVGMPETFFGDLNTGNLATASSLDRPTELKFVDRQNLWKDILTDIVGFLLESRGIVKPQFNIAFPPILQHSVAETITAIVDGATLMGRPLAGTIDMETTSRLILQALGVDDVEVVLAAIMDEYALRDPSGAPPKIAEAAKSLKTELEAFGAKYGAVLQAMKEAA